MTEVRVLGGAQTDFGRNWTREGVDLATALREAVRDALDDARIDASEIGVGHVGNFAGELFTGQGHLGGLLVEADPAFDGLPTSRHEAACASGSVALLAALADLEAGRYETAIVVGVEVMRNVPGAVAAANLGAAAWVPQETDGVPMVWPKVFAELGDEYDRRYGLDDRHLAMLGRASFEAARRNPNAQTRTWQFTEESFAPDDHANPVVLGRLRRHDCSQISDGAVAVVLASGEYAARWAERRGVDVASVPRISGWGHRTGRMTLADKVAASAGEDYVLPHVRATVTDAFARAGIPGVGAVDAFEVHDCFTTTHYMAIDHLGITAPGASWQAIEDGATLIDGPHPVNPSGGLVGVGHPVGATGVRMLLDGVRQVTGRAGDYQVEGARRAGTLNIGGSATTAVSLIVERDT